MSLFTEQESRSQINLENEFMVIKKGREGGEIDWELN